MLYWIAMYTATHWPDVTRYAPGSDWFIPFTTMVHVSIYAGWAAIWCWVLSVNGRVISQKALICLILGGAAYAAFDELTQALVGRHPRVQDFSYDMIGVVVAVSILAVWQRRQRRHAPPTDHSSA